MTTAQWKMRAASLFGLLAAVSAAGAQETMPPPTPLRPALRRVLLLPPPAPDARMQKWIVTERAAALQGPRRGGLFGLFATHTSAPKAGKPEPAQKPGKGEKALPPPDATPEQLHALCEALLYDALAERLRTQRRLVLPTEAEVRTALGALHLTLASLQNAAAARRLGRELDCDAVLLPKLASLERHEGATRSMTLRGTMQFVLLDPSVRSIEGASGRGRRRNPPLSVLPPTFPFFGTAVTGRVLFKASYRRTAVQLTVEAAQQAAAVAAHTFWTGEIAPFARAEERIALLPVPAPADVDALLFTPEGRRVATAAVRDLPADLATQFEPDTAPLHGEEIVSAARSRALLRQEGMMVEALWRQDQPETARVQALGARLEVSYVLMAHITAAELQTGTPDSAQAFAVREARAEAVGALVRISDGAVVWQDRATATMTLRPTGDNKTKSLDKEAVEKAEHYALTALQRRFRAYRARFEN